MRLIRSHGGIYWYTAVCIILVGECSRLQGWNSSRGRLVKSRGGRKLRREGGRVACPRPLLWPRLLGPSSSSSDEDSSSAEGIGDSAILYFSLYLALTSFWPSFSASFMQSRRRARRM